MKKQVAIFLADQVKVTHFPGMIFDTTYEDIRNVADEDFKNSVALRACFAEASIKTIIIMIYKNTDGEERRRIAGCKEEDTASLKQVMTMMADSIDVKLSFYDFENAKKILPMDKVHRANLKLLIENSQKWTDLKEDRK